MQTQLVPADNSTPNTAALTPMMAQYHAVKEQYPECLLFYRMGDFYELFFDDAVKAAAALDITLTKRGETPMCGVPWHSHESYLARLIKLGYKVAICEQVETPEEAKKRGGYKALVQRDVIRVITQGTLTEDTLLEKNANNYLTALADIAGTMGIAWLDLSTGDFTLQPLLPKDLGATIERVNPGEILVSDKLVQQQSLFEVLNDYKSKLTIQPHSRFDSENARKRLEKLFGVGTLESFGAFSRAEIAAAGALIDYVELTQKGKFPRLSPPKQLMLGSVMEIDAATRRNLELTHTLAGQRTGSLLSTMDMTVTGGGARLLASHLAMPLTTPEEINARLDMVEHFAKNTNVRHDTRGFLRQCADIERALIRLSLERGGPRDLACIRDTLGQTVQLVRVVEAATRTLTSNPLPQAGEEVKAQSASPRPLAGEEGAHAQHGKVRVSPAGITKALDILKMWGAHHPLIDQLQRALATELPVLTRDGGFIARGYSPKLDELTQLRDESRLHIAQLQAKYVQKSGVSSLKIKHNNILGYFIEVTTNNADKLFANTADFIHRQTMANAARFTTTELAELERKISEAAEKALALELQLFADLVQEVLAQGELIAKTANALASLDVASALAELAVTHHYTRPQVDASLAFEIKGGRHPVVEVALKKQSNTDFIANDCVLATRHAGLDPASMDAASSAAWQEGRSQLWLLTGPNMAGKSTFLRQNALIALMAQMGSYVPAQAAHIGAVDRLFSRVGAADDLARGRSTFMVEMVETATILNQATARSLVILDEIGRGTATYDGLSIAWACLEYLHEINKCRALFATHYHELTSLTQTLPNLSCHTMRVKEWKDSIIFLHEIAAGTADRSYGIHVAKLAGLPATVITRAEDVLKNIEGKKSAKTLKDVANDLPLFTAAPAPVAAKPSAAEEALKDLNPDTLSPRDALDALYRLKGMV